MYVFNSVEKDQTWDCVGGDQAAAAVAIARTELIGRLSRFVGLQRRAELVVG